MTEPKEPPAPRQGGISWVWLALIAILGIVFLLWLFNPADEPAPEDVAVTDTIDNTVEDAGTMTAGTAAGPDAAGDQPGTAVEPVQQDE